MSLLKSLFSGKTGQTGAAHAELPRHAPVADAEQVDGLLVNAYATVRVLPALDFPCAWAQARDSSDPELAAHLNGFQGYVFERSNIKTEGDKITRNALGFYLIQHIGAVKHQVSFVIDPAQRERVSAWAAQANAVFYLPDGSICDPQWRVLIDAAGHSQSDAQVPHPADALARRARTLAALAQRQIRALPNMPPVPGADEVALRPAAEVMQRALALVVVAACGDLWASDGAPDLDWLRKIFPQGFSWLSPQEQAFMADGQPEQSMISNMTWRYEALNLLLWALGAVAGLSDGEPAHAPDLLKIMADLNRDADAIGKAELRPAAEILDALDMTYRLHWTAREAQLGRGDAGAVNGDVIAERHTALNWLTGFQNPPDVEWDQVDTPT
ncbi:MAG: DUF4272 domain-containing protein [Gallionellaceae bacterium]|jgi:hypothetical protein|nr:DUF4272 domain-containing protein [Gallionellaceae bacterium]